MLKSLFPMIDWDTVKYVGFDMDGTLYDELDFISQVYMPIASRMAKFIGLPADDIYQKLLERWLEKGSSYNRIFEEILSQGEVCKDEKEGIIQECLHIFRNYLPELALTHRVTFLLQYFHQKYELFLITDGGVQLQQSKFHALGLSKWFDEQNVGFTGLYGSAYGKPSPLIVTKIKVLREVCNPQHVVFFGDREVDEKFAKGLGYQFVLTKCLQKEGLSG
ncbi:HAD family hydrolase [Brevibacillus agri]